jgi:hypothetical protein
MQLSPESEALFVCGEEFATEPAPTFACFALIVNVPAIARRWWVASRTKQLFRTI